MKSLFYGLCILLLINIAHAAQEKKRHGDGSIPPHPVTDPNAPAYVDPNDVPTYPAEESVTINETTGTTKKSKRSKKNKPASENTGTTIPMNRVIEPILETPEPTPEIKNSLLVKQNEHPHYTIDATPGYSDNMLQLDGTTITHISTLSPEIQINFYATWIKQPIEDPERFYEGVTYPILGKLINDGYINAAQNVIQLTRTIASPERIHKLTNLEIKLTH